MATMQELEDAFSGYPSIDSSVQDFEVADRVGSHNTNKTSSQVLYPPHHTGRRYDSESELIESSSEGQYSPPAWRRDSNGNRNSGFWKQAPILQRPPRPIESRESSPEYDFTTIRATALLEAASRTRLPTGSLSPEKRRSPSPGTQPLNDEDDGNRFGRQSYESKSPGETSFSENNNNYIRFALQAEVNHQTEPFGAGYSLLRSWIESTTCSWSSMIRSMIIAIVSIVAFRALFQPGPIPPVPDLVRVAGLAKAFEPLIFYSENGAQQIDDLQATGIAVWDLGESVRTTNMTSAPIIVKELDDLSENLKILAVELTRFFANVDGDVDGILIVMDWARRELSQLQTTPSSSLHSIMENAHAFLRRCGILETSSGIPTHFGTIVTSILGLSIQQRTEVTLQKTFHEFLAVLEEAINSELSHSLALFSLFSSIDQRFHNLARLVAREANAQDNAQDDLLSSLWAKILGPNSGAIHTFQRNKRLLTSIRSKMVQNKSLIEDHNRKLLTLKANLENLRRKVVSPLLRANASTIGVEEQIRGLEEVAGYLGGVREKQRGKLMEFLYGAGWDGKQLQSSNSNLGKGKKMKSLGQ